MASTVGTRLAFEKAKQAINNAGFSLDTAVLSQSYLRSECDITNTTTVYTFPILVNDVSNTNSVTYPTEQRLNLQDAFCVSEISLQFFPYNTTNDTTWICQTYGQSAKLNSTMQSFYNGKMRVTVNNRVIVPTYDLYRHYFAPMYQTQANQKDQYDQNNASKDAFYPVEPNWVLVGSKQNKIEVTLPTPANQNTVFPGPFPNPYARVAIIMRGHLAQNVTPVR